jgi:hypothetical protein
MYGLHENAHLVDPAPHYLVALYLFGQIIFAAIARSYVGTQLGCVNSIIDLVARRLAPRNK